MFATTRKVCPQSGLPRTLFDYVGTAAVAVFLALQVQAFVVKPYLIPSTVDRLTFRFAAIQRGDIIVFRCPQAPHEVLIKRVVGLPGDLLWLHGGSLY